jgi:hypothetical protein
MSAADRSELDQIQAMLAAQQAAIRLILLTMGTKRVIRPIDLREMRAEALKMAAAIGRRFGQAPAGVRLEEALEELFAGAGPGGESNTP